MMRKPGQVFNQARLSLLVVLPFLLTLCLSPWSVFATEEVFYYHNDHLGSPVAITDVGGNVVWRADYEPFGKTAILQEGVSNPQQFIGRELDVETGFHYLGARYYDSGLGRFLSIDPVSVQFVMANSQKLNRYLYAGNNPYLFIDWSGME